MNYLSKTLISLGITLLVLSLLSLFGKIAMRNLSLKEMNIFNDIQSEKLIQSSQLIVGNDSMQQALKANDSIEKLPRGIEDFSPEKNALKFFFGSLRNSRNQPTRVAFFGDSFIEGDILCANFRDTLQHLYGGRGVGFIPITSEVSKFRTTIQHDYSNWKTFSIVGAKSSYAKLGTSGYCFVPSDENEVEYKPAIRGRTFSFHHVKLFIKSQNPSTFSYVINDTLSFSQNIEAQSKLQEFNISQEKIHTIKFQFPASDSLKVYGTSFEESTGIYVDNFAMRGNSGIGLYQIEPTEHKEFNEFRNYKLIILQYGLNVVHETDTAGYGWYTERMVTVINRLKESFPLSSFLLLSVSDRSSNQVGKFETIPAIPVMVEAQREIAKKTKIAFWDVYSAMGGKNSMVKFVNSKPTLASKDYTHLNYWGGKKIAKLMADALLAEKHYYEKK